MNNTINELLLAMYYNELKTVQQSIKELKVDICATNTVESLRKLSEQLNVFCEYSEILCDLIHAVEDIE